jgi:putative protease
MSLGVYNSSANRGACFQNCRRKYRITDDETGDELVVDNQFVMSPKDLCTIGVLDQLAAAGVSVFKLEGRGRSADYVSVVTRAYREALDALAKGSYNDELAQGLDDRLRTVFNRGFWQGGYYLGTRLGEWSGRANSQATRRRTQIGVVENYFAKVNVAEFTLQQPELVEGSLLLFEGPTTGAVHVAADDLRIDGKKTRRAEKGDRVTVAVPVKVRRNDRVFVLSER